MKQDVDKFSCNVSDIQIQHEQKVDPNKIQSLYLSVGWHYRDVQTIRKSLEKSILVTTAWEGESLVGVARATGDGVFNATIWDFAVKEQYQNKGIGSLILNSMVTKLDDCGIPLITLYTAYTNKNFYSKLGFEFNLEQVFGMYRYKK